MMLPESNIDLETRNEIYHKAQDRMSLLPNYYRWIYRKFAPFLKGDVLELGAGTGHFLQNYMSDASTVCAVDYNQKILSELQQRFDPEKVLPLFCDLKEDWTELEGCHFDCVVALDVLEHFQDDQAFLLKVNRVLKEDGLFLVKVPAQSRLYSRIDEASGHYRRYDPDVLTGRTCSAGFAQIMQAYMNPLGALVYSTRKKPKTNFSRTFNPGTLKAINMGLPLITALDSLPGLKGLSLVGVYKKI